MLMRAATVVQQVCKSCRTCFKFYCMFYFTCDRSFSPAYKAGSLRTPRLPGTKPTYRPLPHKCETHITSVYPTVCRPGAALYCERPSGVGLLTELRQSRMLTDGRRGPAAGILSGSVMPQPAMPACVVLRSDHK